MKVELEKHWWDDASGYWLDLGIGYRATDFHFSHFHVINLSFIFFTVYLRWGAKQKK